MRMALNWLLFAAAAAIPLAWAWARRRRWGLPVRVTVDPDDPRPAAIAGYLAQIAQRLDERPERMRVVFDGRNRAHLAITLDLAPDRALRVGVEGRRARALDLRGRWLADHPTPLDLRRATLYVEPVEANRFRVMPAPPFRLPRALYVACSLAVTLGLIWLVPEPIAAGAGLALGGMLSSR